MKIQLNDVQKPHIRTLMDIQERENYCIDTSEMGTGKTISFIQLLAETQIENVVIIVPENVRHDILAEMKKYVRRIAISGELYHDNGPRGKFSIEFLHIVAIMSYHSLGGRASQTGQTAIVARGIGADEKKVEIGIMTRTEKVIYKKNGMPHLKKGVPATEPVFELEPEFAEYLVDEKCALWFDEAHVVRNINTAMNAASICLTSEFRKRSYPIFFSSGTLGNTVGHAISAMILQGMILPGKMDYDHCKKLISWCMLKDPIRSSRIIEREDLSKAAGVREVCYHLYCDVVLPNVSSRMRSFNANAKFVPNDLLLMVDPETYSKVEDIIEEMRLIAESGENVEASGEFRQRQRFLEYIKLPYIMEYARKNVLTNPNAKLLISYNYIKSGKFLEDEMSSDLPVINIYGEVKTRERRDMIQTFNLENNDYRVMVFSMKTMNSGVNLQDKNGNFPRTMFILPSHHYLDAAQVAKRTHRVDSMSDSQVLMPYFCNRETGKICEIDFYNKMTQKSHNLKRQTNSSVIHSPKGLEEEEDTLLPGNYPHLRYETSDVLEDFDFVNFLSKDSGDESDESDEE